MKKRVLMGILGVASVVGAINAVSLMQRTGRCQRSENYDEEKDLSDSSATCNCGGSCGADCCCGTGKSTADDYKNRILYDGNDGSIKKMDRSALEKNYAGRPQPALAQPLVLYYATCGKEEAREISDDENTVFILTPNNGRFEVELNGKVRQYIGVCLPEEELFLWAKANKKELYARPSGKMYSIGQDCNEKWYVQIELLRTC